MGNRWMLSALLACAFGAGLIAQAARDSRRVYVTGHYDSVAMVGGANALTSSLRAIGAPLPDHDVDAPAPGANDDGSGTALTMELARVFASSGIDFDATLAFVCWAGEEQ